MRRVLIVVILALGGFIVEGAPQVMSRMLSGSSISPSAVLTASDQQHYMTGGPTNVVINRSARVRLSLDGLIQEHRSFPWTLEVTYSLDYEYADGTSGTTTGSLTISGSADNTEAQKSLDMDRYRGVSKAVLTITGVTYNDITNYPTVSSIGTLPDDFRLELLVIADRYYELSTSSSPSITQESYNSTKNVLDVSWSYLVGAESYELEWLYVADGELSGTHLSQSIDYDFKNATRVSVSGQSYSIPLSYPKGSIIYRVRGVGYDINSAFILDAVLYSEWSYDPGTRTLSQANSDDGSDPCLYYHSGVDNNKNWTYTATYAEDGKRKEVASYADGSGRTRQQVTVMNAEDVAIVGESVYDYVGRPMVQILPVPTTNAGIQYYGDSQSPFNGDWDRSNFATDAHLNESNDTLPEALPSGAGANQYYSSSNPLSFSNKDAVPQAGGFPYALSQVSNDGSERLKVSSGLGDTLRYKAQNGHNTRNFYGTPTQAELDRLFGLEAGEASFYQKVITLDPNGQQSIQYMDASGRVVATALAGESPESMTTLPNNTTSTLTSVLFGGQMPSPTNGVILQGQQFLSTSFDKVYVDYDLDPVYLYTCRQGDADSSQPEAYSIPYDLRVEVRNDRGDLVASYSDTNITNLEETLFNFDPQIGRYTITRSIEMNRSALDSFLLREAFLMDSTRYDLNSCGPNYLVSSDTLCEPLDCDTACFQSYSYYYNDTLFYLDTAGNVYQPDVYGDYFTDSDPETTYTNYLDNTSASSPFADAIKDCIESCEDFTDTSNAEGIAAAQFLSSDRCSIKWGIMVAQMSPGGEYFDNTSGGYTYDTLGNWVPSDSCYLEVGDLGVDTVCTSHNPNQWLDDSLSFGLDSINNHFGTSYSSWADVRANWTGAYGQYLTRFHPESCAYEYFCGYSFSCGANTIDMDSLNWYIGQMFLVDSFSHVVQGSFNYMNPLGLSATASTTDVTQDQSSYFSGSQQDADPLLCGGASVGTLGRFASDSLSKYLTEFIPVLSPSGTATGNYYSLWYLLDDPDGIAVAHGDNGAGYIDTNVIKIFNLFHGGACSEGLIQSDEQKLLLFRQIYLFLREKVIYDYFDQVYVCPGTGAPYSYWDGDTNYDGILDDGSYYSLVYPKNPIYDNYYGDATQLEGVFKENNGDPVAHYQANSLDTCSRQNFKEYLALNELVDTSMGMPYSYSSNAVIRDTLNSHFCLGYGSAEVDSLLKIIDDSDYGLMYMMPDSLRCNSSRQFLEEATNTCSALKTFLAHQEAERQYQIAKEAYLDSLEAAYVQRAYDQLQGKETVELRYTMGEYHYTLYYYDRADNLIKTVPPKGVDTLSATEALAVNAYRQNSTNPLPSTPLHTYVTNYRYNTQNQVVFQFTPDGDTTKFWYDYASRLVLSQNAVQRDSSEYSYTIYDGLSRVVESGELNDPSESITDSVARIPTLFKSFLYSGSRKQVTYILYDEALDQVSAPSSVRAQAVADAFGAEGQKFLRNRVASSFYLDTLPADFDTAYIFENERMETLPSAYLHYQSASHYSYDPHGNVNRYVQEIHELDSLYDHGFFTLDYSYDLVSGNVNRVVFQKGEADQFFHRYQYDADNRIIAVETSRDGVIFKEDARYTYYPHGPLSRVELGEQNVQGLDYAYTLQGWLKSVNGASLGEGKEFGLYDLGQDARQATQRANFAPDAFAYELDYFNGDYQSIGTTDFTAEISGGTLKTGFKPLFNGNIARMITAMNDNSEDPLDVLANLYQYDQLNRLDNFVSYTASGLNQDNATATATTGGFQAEYSYDPNGNITSLKRYTNYSGNGTPVLFDNLSYSYTSPGAGEPYRNRLDHVDDAYPAALVGDIKDQSSGNYAYDKIGNLIQDSYDTLNLIEWNLQGKITHIDKDVFDIYFEYDPMGNRIKKHETRYDIKTFYVRDAQGNVMATYQDDGTDLNLVERMLYGSDRVGVYKEEVEISSSYSSSATVNAEANVTYSFNTQDDDVSISSSSSSDLFYLGSLSGVTTLSVGEVSILDGSYSVDGSEYVIQPGGYIIFQGSSADIYADGRYDLSSDATFTLSGNAGEFLSIYTSAFDWTVGNKRYELKNHLGNVLSTVSDLKTWKEVNDVTYQLSDQTFSGLNQTASLSSNSNEWTAVAAGSYTIEDYGTAMSFLGYRNDYIRRSVEPDQSGDCNYQYCLGLEFEEGEVDIVITVAATSTQILSQTLTGSGEYCFDISEYGDQEYYVDLYPSDNFAFIVSNESQKWLEMPGGWTSHNGCAGTSGGSGMTVYYNGETHIHSLKSSYEISRTCDQDLCFTVSQLSGTGTIAIRDHNDVLLDSTAITTTGEHCISLSGAGADSLKLSFAMRTGTSMTLTALSLTETCDETVLVANVMSYQDYYPFGMTMNNRSGQDADAAYRYGFNGMEKDNEVHGEGNNYSTEFRQYDPRIGRWASRDPLFANFPWQSSYVAFDNNPIVLSDPKGLAAGDGDPVKTTPEKPKTVPMVGAEPIPPKEPSPSIPKADVEELIETNTNFTPTNCKEGLCCTECLNKNLANLFDREPNSFALPGRKERIADAMTVLDGEGYVNQSASLSLIDAGGNPANGSKSKSVKTYAGEGLLKKMDNMIGANTGYFVFGVAPGNGYHSVLVVVDNTSTETKYTVLDPHGTTPKKAAELEKFFLEYTRAAQYVYSRSAPGSDWDIRTYLWLLQI